MVSFQADNSGLNKMLRILTNIENITDILKDEAEMVVLDVKNRVSDGLATDGTTMQTKSNNSKGNYSEKYAKRREGKSLVITPRNLNFTGEMIDDYRTEVVSENHVAIGFTDKRSADKAEYNELYMGIKVFDISEKEEQSLMLGIEQKINERINAGN